MQDHYAVKQGLMVSYFIKLAFIEEVRLLRKVSFILSYNFRASGES